ncbi:histidine kinase [Novosphingobium resinovorum]
MDTSRFRPTPILRERRRRRCTRFALTDSRGGNCRDRTRHILARAQCRCGGEPPRLNEVVRATLEDGREVWGLVRWREGNLFGVEFDTRG